MESSTLKEALSQIERLSQNPETVRMAISREIHLKDQLQREEDAESRGIEKGTLIRDREIILNMYAESVTAELIAQLTKIPIEKVKGVIESAIQ